MPIHDQSYRRYRGGKAMPGQAWTVIARAGILNMIRKRIFLAVLLAGWAPFVFYAIWLYLNVAVPQISSIAAVNPETFRQFLSKQDFFVFVVTVYVGSGLIANDRRANALQIYLSKPLARSEYIFGKAVVLLAFLLGITLLPGLLLLLLQVLFSGTFEFIRKNVFLIPAIVTASLLQSLLATFTMLALSSLSKSARFVAIMYTGTIFFTFAIFGVLAAITASSRLSWVALAANVQQVTDVIFRQPARYQTPWQVSLLVIFALIALSVSVLERRVRGVEVVT